MSAPRIKICGISSPKALDACLSAGVDYIGLVFFSKSPRNVSIELAAALSRQAHGRIKVAGLFVDPENDFIETVRRSVTLDVIQLHGSERPAHVAQLNSRHGLEIWKSVGIRKRDDFTLARKYLGAASRILYDAKPPQDSALPGGTGLRIDWKLFVGQAHPLPWILAGGLDPRNVAEAIRLTGAPLVDTSSGVESAPGVKDPDRIAQFCAAARAA